MLRRTLILIALVLLAAPAAAHELTEGPGLPGGGDGVLAPGDQGGADVAPGEGEVEDPQALLELLLSHYHELPSRASLEARIPDVEERLRALADDEEAFVLYRDRAIAVLAEYPDERTLALYRALLAAPETREMLRHRVMGLMAHAYGARVVEDLRPWLAHEDLQFRLSAAHALRKLEDAAAREALRDALERETHPVVREVLVGDETPTLR